MLAGKKILLGVSGGIAAYKAPLVVRSLVGAGAEVRVVLTKSATEFVTPLALSTVSGHRVGLELFGGHADGQIDHIELARWPELILIAPATANVLARLRVGICDDLLTTLACATTAPILLAPSMNTQMWFSEAVQENVGVLRGRRGVRVVEPDAGDLACNEVGPGRMPDPDVLTAEVIRSLTPPLLADRRVVVSAGPTREAIDPVRFLSNPSSGKMGFAIAEAAAMRGAQVDLVAGPCSLNTPTGVRRHDVVSAQQMFDTLMGLVERGGVDAVVKAAAVADWRPIDVASEKMKKHDGVLTIELERTQDILRTLGQLPSARRPFLVGFAAETGELEAKARAKFVDKNVDLLVANDVTREGAGFGGDGNAVLFVDAHTAVDFGPTSKRGVADELWRRAVRSPRWPS